MTPESSPTQHEAIGKTYTAPPAMESLVLPDPSQESWLEDISTNESFQEQVRERRDIITHIDTVFSHLPRADMSIEEALKENILSEEQVSNLYTSLSNLIGNDDYKRALLYIPFEYLPNKDWNPESDTLKKSIEQFRAIYMHSWESLLYTHDVRANFVDGDVLEVELRTGDVPRVVKAAHLIPVLVQKGMLDIHTVLALMDSSEDVVLKQSILDALYVLGDLDLIDNESQNHLYKLEDSENTEGEEQGTLGTQTIEDLAGELQKIEREKYSGMTSNREKWVKQEKKRKIVEVIAKNLSKTITQGTVPSGLIDQITSPESSPELKHTYVLGIQHAIEEVHNVDQTKAKAIYEQYKNDLVVLWNTPAPEIQDAISTTLYRLHGLNILSDTDLQSYNLSIPALAGPFSENIKRMEDEISHVQEVIRNIESNSELSLYVYPIALISGSRLKGYAKSNADVDIAVCIKPGTPHSKKELLENELKKAFRSEQTPGEIIMFWLDETASGLSIHNFEKTDSSTGESYWTQNLFGSVWEGNKQVIEEVRKKLLTQYMYETDEVIHEVPARKLYIEELERDTLQYRLMHKGYARFFAPVGGIHTEHSSHIDSDSMFWDSGYRQTALKLYANKVFLPNISVEK